MDYKVKLAAVRRLKSAVCTVVNRHYTDEVGAVRHTPKVYRRVLKRHLKAQRIKLKRAELTRFAKIAFLLSNCQQMDRKQVEIIFRQLFVYGFLLELLFEGFNVSTAAVRRVLIRLYFVVKSSLISFFVHFSRLFDERIYLSNSEFLI